METVIDMVIYFIRLYIMNICVYYCFCKISNRVEKSVKKGIIVFVTNLIILFIYVNIRSLFKSFFPFIVLCFIYGVILSKVTSNKLGYSIIVTIISYAITYICQGMATIIQFIPYKLLDKLLNMDNQFISLIMIITIQFTLIYSFFKIKRFKNGFGFINNKLNNEVTDIIMINVSTIAIIICCLVATESDTLTKNFFIAFITIAFTIYSTIHKMLKMHYKQKLLTDTMEEYKKELAEKQSEIDVLKQDKKNVSKITHEFYNRQKALELLVTSNMNADNIDKENISPNVLQIIDSLTNEYSERFEQVKELAKLDETGILEIDNMFKYMQSECHKNNINFKLKVMGNIHYLVNNLISKNKLETLIGDHLRDAINAVNLREQDNKEILTILGIKNKKYELSIYDTGVDFTVDTLMKLGVEAVTTNADRGGTGTGFMTTFETLAETKASLIITEYPKTKESTYTKCITIRFDDKKQYKIRSYRPEELKLACASNRIKIEKINNK